MSVRLSYKAPYSIGGHQPKPIVFGYIDERLIDWWPCGIIRKRVSWLPAIPYLNTYWDYSQESIEEFMERLRKHLTSIENSEKNINSTDPKGE